MTIHIGDTVRVKGVKSPKMVVLEQSVADDDTVYSCLWFDEHQVARQLALKSALLEPIERDTHLFDQIPVLGFVK